MNTYTYKPKTVFAFQITDINFIKPKQLANAPVAEEFIQLIGLNDTINVDREFLAKNQPNIGNWYITSDGLERVVDNDYFTNTYTEVHINV